MRRRLLKQVLVGAMAAIMVFEMPARAPAFLTSLAYEQKSASVKVSSLNVRSGAGTSYSKVTSLNHGQAVTITDEVTGSDGAAWAKITYAGGSGYVLREYLKTAVSYATDENFEAQLSAQGFPESYKIRLREIHGEYPSWVFQAQKTGLDWEDVIKNESIVGRNLVYKTSKSSWKSTAAGAFDWGNNYWPGFDSSAWVAASEGIIRYYMDPRNFLDSSYVFQFMLQSYDASAHTAEGVESLAKGTFLEGKASSGSGSTSAGTTGGAVTGGPGETGSSSSETVSSSGETEGTGSSVSLTGPTASIQMNTGVVHAATIVKGPGSSITSGSSGSSSGSSYSGAGLNGKSYIDIILEAANESGVNPYVLTSMIIQEQGTQGNSGLINGNTSGYAGIYNFFNIQAYATDTMTAVQRGLWWASQSGSYGRPWNSIEKAIIGGADCYGENFVRNGQDTFYLKKFNVQGSNLYQHEYMTNVEGAASEGYKLGEAYSDTLKQTALTFKIPIFNNMPDTPVEAPTTDGSPNNKLSSLGVDGFQITPSFNMDTASYDLIVDPGVSGVNVSAAAIDSKAQVGGTGSISLNSDNISINVSVTAENGDVRTYVINIVKQSGGAVGNGTASSGSSSAGSTSSGSSGGPGASNSGTVTANHSESTAAQSGGASLVGPPGNG